MMLQVEDIGTDEKNMSSKYMIMKQSARESKTDLRKSNNPAEVKIGKNGAEIETDNIATQPF